MLKRIIGSNPIPSVYTDGSCSPNPGNGAYASLIILNNNEYWITGAENNTTNNRMELKAICESLKYLNINFHEINELNLYTDSTYAQKGITKWIYNWHKNSWKIKGNLIINCDLWQDIWFFKQIFKINAFWVKSHSDNYYNNIVDKKAKSMIQI